MKCRIGKPNGDALKHVFKEGLGLEGGNDSDGSGGARRIVFCVFA